MTTRPDHRYRLEAGLARLFGTSRRAAHARPLPAQPPKAEPSQAESNDQRAEDEDRYEGRVAFAGLSALVP